LTLSSSCCDRVVDISSACFSLLFVSALLVGRTRGIDACGCCCCCCNSACKPTGIGGSSRRVGGGGMMTEKIISLLNKGKAEEK